MGCYRSGSLILLLGVGLYWRAARARREPDNAMGTEPTWTLVSFCCSAWSS